MATKTEAAPDKGQRDRSPAYPFISLRSAVDRLRELEAVYKNSPAPADRVGMAWKMKEKSSQAFQTLAALKYFGLIEYTGTGDDRKAIISGDGKNYLRAQQDSTKSEILKRAALKPRQISAFWTRWGSERPQNAAALDTLMMEHRYTESAAKTFLKVYDDTLSFAGLSESDKTEENSDVGDVPKVGDTVQWEPGGVAQFSEPKRIVRASENGQFVFVEGSNSGIPVKEVSKMTSNAALPNTPKPPVPEVITPPSGFQQDVLALPEGKIVLQWPMTLAAESLEDVEEWLEFQVKKLKRLTGKKPA